MYTYYYMHLLYVLHTYSIKYIHILLAPHDLVIYELILQCICQLIEAIICESSLFKVLGILNERTNIQLQYMISKLHILSKKTASCPEIPLK